VNFCLIWFSGFRAEDLNVKAYNVRRTDDGRQVMAKAHMAFNHMAETKLRQIWLEWSLGSPLSILCPTAPPSIQNGCCY
jgi:hypothetical protein